MTIHKEMANTVYEKAALLPLIDLFTKVCQSLMQTPALYCCLRHYAARMSRL